jgi:plastocyanin
MRNHLTALLGLVLWVACGAAQAASVNITVGPNNSETFSPTSVTINVGDSVTFNYAGGSMPHNAVSDGVFRCARGCDGKGGNGNATGNAWVSTVTLSTPGSYNFYCELHGTPTAGMHGTIIVNGTAPPADFGLSADSSSLAVTQGSSAAVGVTVSPQNGFSGTVTYAASGLPPGVSAAFVNDSATHATLTLSAQSGAATGTANVTITATSGSLVHTASVALNVVAATPVDFGISTDSSNINLAQGASATVGVTVSPQNGFSGSVTYAASGLPPGVSAAFANDSATHATLTLSAQSAASTGVANITITATSGSLVHTASVALNVVAATPAFSIVRGITGSWYNPAQSGQGFNVEVLSGNTFIAFWYVFDSAGNNLWLTGIGPYNSDSVTLTMTQTSGGAFPPAFDATKIVRGNWGTLTLRFSDCNNGTATWVSDDGTQTHFPNGSMPIQRLTGVATLSCP